MYAYNFIFFIFSKQTLAELVPMDFTVVRESFTFGDVSLQLRGSPTCSLV